MPRVDTTDGTILLIGTTCGARSMLGPAIVANALRGQSSGTPQPARALGGSRTATVLGILAAGELVGDKLPRIPARVAPPAMMARIASGALVGAAVAAARGTGRRRGMMIGGIAAVVAAVATYRARRWLVKATGIPDPLVAVAEDLLVLRLASGLSPAIRPAAGGGVRSAG
ncbi:MAG TPA: hypothetical protein VK922_03410 [Gemmatimonadaceae bacterium]|nr:hypothetical protein [Gemmatimonadaceae bacterium]